MLLPGTAITYNGEEIGMTDGVISWNQTVDPLGRMSGPKKYQETSRDPFRTPFQWNSNENAGEYAVNPQGYRYTSCAGTQHYP